MVRLSHSFVSALLSDISHQICCANEKESPTNHWPMMPVQPPPPWTHGHVDALVEMEEKLQQLRSYHKLPAQRKESFENGLISGFLENFPGEGLKIRVLLDLVRRPSLNSLPSGRGVENILDKLQNSPSLPNGPMSVPGPVLPNFGLPPPNSPFIPNWSMAAEAHVPPNLTLTLNQISRTLNKVLVGTDTC